MGRLHRLTLLLCLSATSCVVVASACGKSEPREGEQVFSRDTVREAQRPLSNPNRVLDENGELVESNLRIAGLVLPRGLVEKRIDGRLHEYETSVPVEKVQRYFGPRLITGTVDRIGQGVLYKTAAVRGMPADAPRVEVSILPLSTGRHGVTIVELAPVPRTLPNEDRAREYLMKQQREAQ